MNHITAPDDRMVYNSMGESIEGWIRINRKVEYGDAIANLWPRVYLDGVEQRGVWMADPRRGVLIRDVVDQHGKYVHDGENFQQEKVHGKVEVFIRACEAHYDPDRPINRLFWINRAITWLLAAGVVAATVALATALWELLK